MFCAPSTIRVAEIFPAGCKQHILRGSVATGGRGGVGPFICQQTRNCARTTGSPPLRSPTLTVVRGLLSPRCGKVRKKCRGDTDIFPNGRSKHKSGLLWGLLSLSTHWSGETKNVREQGTQHCAALHPMAHTLPLPFLTKSNAPPPTALSPTRSRKFCIDLMAGWVGRLLPPPPPLFSSPCTPLHATCLLQFDLFLNSSPHR